MKEKGEIMTLDEIQSLTDIEQVESFQNLLISHATGGNINEIEYKILREILINNSFIKDRLPEWIRTHRDADQFWHFIKHKFSTYAERRDYLWAEFSPLLSYLEDLKTNKNNLFIAHSINFKEIDNNAIQNIWEKSLKRANTDPEGAITSARTLIESVCKYILVERKITYKSSSIELSELYRLTAKELNLAPEQHNEKIFKQILGGCSGIINGLGTLRNKLGDAHGVSGKPVRPSPRHAILAVNLAGSMSFFLLETHQANTI